MILFEKFLHIRVKTQTKLTLMKYISYSVKMNVSRYPVRHISAGGQFCENEQFPFDRLCLEIKETHHCPFCDKGTVNSNCNCEKFATQLAKLQESVHDNKHATLIHVRKSLTLWQRCYCYYASIIDARG